MKKIVVTTLCLVFAVAGSASAFSTNSLGVAGDYNLFTLNSTVANKLHDSDSEGSVAIAGSAEIHNYSVASVLSGSDAKFVVGGTLTMTNGQVGKDGSGSIYSGGATLTNVNPATSKNLSQSDVDFASAANYLTSASSQWARQAATGSVTGINDGALTLTGTGSSLEVFNLNISDLENAYRLTVADVISNATVLVNIAGTGMSNDYSNIAFDFFGMNSMILYNFYEAESLTFGSIEGSVLAASAVVNFNGGNIDGQMIADSIDAQGEFHNVAFQGDLPAVPLPCSLWLLGGGLLCLSCLRRRNV